MSALEEWAQDFFSGLFVDLWLAATSEQQTRQEANFHEIEGYASAAQEPQ